jgi:hypothetical protein
MQAIMSTKKITMVTFLFISAPLPVPNGHALKDMLSTHGRSTYRESPSGPIKAPRIRRTH